MEIFVDIAMVFSYLKKKQKNRILHRLPKQITLRKPKMGSLGMNFNNQLHTDTNSKSEYTPLMSICIQFDRGVNLNQGGLMD